MKSIKKKVKEKIRNLQKEDPKTIIKWLKKNGFKSLAKALSITVTPPKK